MAETITESQTVGDSTLEATVSVDKEADTASYELTLSPTDEGVGGAGALVQEADVESGTITINVNGVNRLTSAVANKLDEITGRTGGLFDALDTAQTLGLVPSFNRPSFPQNFTGGAEFDFTSSSSPQTFSQQFNIPNIEVPAAAPDEFLEQLPDITFRVQSTFGTSALTRRQVHNFTITIPGSAFVESRTPEPCQERPEVQDAIQQIDSLRQDIISSAETLRAREDRIESVANEVANVAGISQVELPEINTSADRVLTDGGGAVARVAEIDFQQLVNQGEINRAGLLTRVKSIPSDFPGDTTLAQLRSRLDSLRNSDVRPNLQRCADLFDQELDNLENVLNSIEQSYDQFVNLREELVQALELTEVLGCVGQFPSIGERVASLEQLVEQSPPEELAGLSPTQFISDISTDPQSLLEDIQNSDELSGECREQFESRVEQAISSIEGAEGCTQQLPRSLRTEINNFESDAQSVLQRGTSISGGLSELLTQGQDLRSRIRNADISSGCKSQVSSRVSSTLSELRALQERKPPEIDCASEYSNIQSRVNQIRDRASGLSAPTSQQVASFSSDAERLINDIQQQVDENECQREFTNRVSQSLSSVRSRLQQVRIAVGEPGGRREERQQRIQELQEQVNVFLEEIPEREDVDVPEDVSDIGET